MARPEDSHSTVEPRRLVPPAAAALLGFSVLTSVGFADGGVFPRTWRLSTVALCAVAAAALLGRERIALTRLEGGVVALICALAGWTALSATWSGRPTESLLQAERVLVYVVAVLAVLLVVERSTVPHLLGGIVAGITAVAGYGLGEYILSPPPLDPFEGRLLHRPFGYANALGISIAIGILVCVGLALRARKPELRAAALLPLVVLVPALYLTSSRGAWLALIVGLVSLARVGGRVRPRTAAVVAGIAAAVVVATLIASGGVDTLATVAGDNRADYWRVAWDDYRAHPVLGAGAGTYGHYWLAHGVGTSFTRTAHSLYLQSLAELGPVGLTLVVAALGCPLLCLRRRPNSIAAAAAAGYIAYLVHTGVDWDWEMPAATLAGLFCGASLLVGTRRQSIPTMSFWLRASILVAVIGVACVALVRLGSGPSSPFGP